MRFIKVSVLALALTAVLASGCATQRDNLVYRPTNGSLAGLDRPVKGTIISLDDARENYRAYPKQVIKHTGYSGDVSFDINDRTVSEVFSEALQLELGRMGVNLVRVKVDGPLNKETSETIRKMLTREYPNVKVAFGANITSFIAESKRAFITTDVEVKASMQFFVLDVATGDTIWAEFSSNYTDVVAKADRNYMIGKLDDSLADLLGQAIKDNPTLKEFLVKIADR